MILITQRIIIINDYFYQNITLNKSYNKLPNYTYLYTYIFLIKRKSYLISIPIENLHTYELLIKK